MLPPGAGEEGGGEAREGGNMSAGVGEVLQEGAEVLTMSRVMCTLDLGSNSDTGLHSFGAQCQSVYCSMCVNRKLSSDTTATFGVCDVISKVQISSGNISHPIRLDISLVACKCASICMHIKW